MNSIVFPFKEEHSPIFGTIRRPTAEVCFKHQTRAIWRPLSMVVDTGADYTLLPRFLAYPLGVDLSTDCKIITAQGVGGSSSVYFLNKRIRIRIGAFERKIPVGFLFVDYIPPLLGRQEFFETFKVTFDRFHTTFEE